MSGFLENLRQTAEAKNIPIMSENTETFFHKLLQTHQFSYALEIGSCISYSSSIIAQLIAKHFGHLTTFEVSYPHYQQGLSVVATLGLHNITNYYGNFLHLNLGDCLHRKLDFVFIDGRKVEYHLYLQKIVPYLADNYYIICDDVIKFSKKLTSLYNFLDQNQIKYTVKQLDDDDGIMIIDSNSGLLEKMSK